MTEKLQKLIEENIALIDKDFLEFADKIFTYNHALWPELCSMMVSHFGYFRDFKTKWAEFEQTLNTLADNFPIAKKYGLGFKYETAYRSDDISLTNVVNWPKSVYVKIDVSNVDRMYKDCQLSISSIYSIDIRCQLKSPTGRYSHNLDVCPLQDVMKVTPSDVCYKQDEFFKDVTQRFEQFCNTFEDKLENLYKQFDVLEELEATVIPGMIERMRKIIAPLFKNVKFETDVSEYYPQISIITYVDNSPNSIPKIQIPYDVSVGIVKLNVDSYIDQWKKGVQKAYDKQQKRLERQASREANRPDNYKKLTLKDIKKAIVDVGYSPSSMSYTNKNVDTTSYKFAFMDIDDSGLEQIKTKLIEMGGDVKNVETRVTYSSRGSYKSLVVTLNN